MNNRSERIYNLYTIFTGGYLRLVGVKEYRHAGSEQELDRFLEERARDDFIEALLFPVPEGMRNRKKITTGEFSSSVTYKRFRDMLKNETEMVLFEPALREVKAPRKIYAHIYSVFLDGAACRELGNARAAG